jgi:hypothetical protein
MRLIGCSLAFLIMAVAGEANPVQFDTDTYNFALTGGGGGVSGVLSGDLSVETFCDNFDNDIFVGRDYSAYLSTLTTGSNLSHTRFGSNSSWQTISISGDTIDAAIINDADALARYQMAAFLVSQYQIGQGGNALNNGVQAAIWDILDPSSSPEAPAHSDADAALKEAAEWYANPNSNRAFLADFLIISDPSMSWVAGGDPLSGGFQEQLTMLPPTLLQSPIPEPRAAVWFLAGLFLVFGCPRRLARPMKSWKFSS